MITIETARLILRPPAERHGEAFASIHEDPEVARYLLGGVPTVTGPDVAWRNVAMLLGHWQLRGFGSWAIEHREIGAVIGRVGFWQPPSWPAVELTWLIRRADWGQGYATEAAQAALSWACSAADMASIISLIQPANQRSIRVAEKLGMTCEGERPMAGVLHLQFALTLTR